MVRLDFPQKIETERLVLHPLKYEEAEEIFYTYASKPEATRYVSWPTHRTISDTRDFLGYAVEHRKLGLDYSFSVRLKEAGTLIGSFGVINDNGKIQIGYVFSPSRWGNGYATEVCRVMMPILKKMPDVFRIGTFVDADNVASIKVLLKSGLIEEGRLPKWFRFVNQDNEPKDCIFFRLPTQ